MILEQEIKDRLRSSLKEAASDARLLGILPMQGPTYERLRENMLLAETCCRQLGQYREDARWFLMSGKMEHAKELTRRWIVGHQARNLFPLLAEKLDEMARVVGLLETRKTERVGIIMPGDTVH